MTAAVISPAGIPGGGEYRTDFVTALGNLAAFIATHPDAPLVDPHFEVPVPPGPRGVQQLALEDIAKRLGTDTAPDGHGGLVARRAFGPLVIEARLPAEELAPVDEDYTRGALAVVRADGKGAAA